MSTEVTPESLRLHAEWLDDNKVCQTPEVLRNWADHLERPLPTEPGWYPGIVVERGGESCTGALLADDDGWRTAREVDGRYGHWTEGTPNLTIRWAEQDGTTPGQTFWEASLAEGRGHIMVSTSGVCVEDWRNESNAIWHPSCELIAAAVLAAHCTPTLTPVGDSPEPGTSGAAVGDATERQEVALLRRLRALSHLLRIGQHVGPHHPC